MYLDPTSLTDFLAVLDLLAYIRQGVFDSIHILQSAATWSRSRHSGLLGQPPLRSRSAPLGLSSLTPTEDEKVRSANLILEILSRCSEQAHQCVYKAIGLTVIFPEDLGGPLEGPASIWMSREFQLLEGCRDARRAAGYLCHITGAHYKRPLRIFSTSLPLRARLSLGWPHLEFYQGKLSYRGPLPISCHCGQKHSSLIGLTDTDDFRTYTSVGLGPQFGDLMCS